MDGWKAAWLVIGPALLLLAAVLALTGITADGADCGTVFAPENYSASTTDVRFGEEADCVDAINSRRLWAGGTAAAGVVLTIYGIIRQPGQDSLGSWLGRRTTPTH